MNRARSHSIDAATVRGRRCASTTRQEPEDGAEPSSSSSSQQRGAAKASGRGHRRRATTSSCAFFLNLSARNNERPLGGGGAVGRDDSSLLVGRSAMGGGAALENNVDQDQNCGKKTVYAANVEEKPSLTSSLQQDDKASRKNSGGCSDEQRSSQQRKEHQLKDAPGDRSGLRQEDDDDLIHSIKKSPKPSSARRSKLAHGVGNSLRRVFVKQQQEEAARSAAADPLATCSSSQTNVLEEHRDAEHENGDGGTPGPITSDDFRIDQPELKDEEYEKDEKLTKMYNTPRLMDSFRLETYRENRNRGDHWLVGLIRAWTRHWYDGWRSITQGFGWATWSLVLVVTLMQPVLTLVVLPVFALVLRYGRRMVTQAAASVPTTTKEAALWWRWLRQKLRQRWNAFVAGAQRGQAVFALAMVLRYLQRPPAAAPNQHNHRRRRD